MNTKVVGRRVGAFIINAIVWYVIVGGLFAVFADRRSGHVDFGAVYARVQLDDTTYAITSSKAWIYYAILFVVWLVYFVVIPGLLAWTLGHLIVGVRIIRADASRLRPGFGRQFLRQVLWIVDDFPYFIPGLTGFIVAMTTKRNQRVGDLAAGTIVVHKSAVRQVAVPDAAAGPPDAVGAGAATEAGTEGATEVQPAVDEGDAERREAGTVESKLPGEEGEEEEVTSGAESGADDSGDSEEDGAGDEESPEGAWYPDPSGQHRLRYWDGSKWTDHAAD